jgi:hypothetical protein
MDVRVKSLGNGVLKLAEEFLLVATVQNVVRDVLRLVHILSGINGKTGTMKNMIVWGHCGRERVCVCFLVILNN